MLTPVPAVGEPARPFRLPAAQGGEIALDDFKGRQNVLLWFTKGMACSFCRQQMSQLARVYPRVKELETEIVQVTTSTPARAASYARRFTLPFPYLCDPDYRVFNAWGLMKRRRGPLHYVRTLTGGLKAGPVPNDFGDFGPALGELPRLLADDDMGLFIVDRGGIVRYALADVYMDAHGIHALPGPQEIVREVQRCAAAA